MRPTRRPFLALVHRLPHTACCLCALCSLYFVGHPLPVAFPLHPLGCGPPCAALPPALPYYMRDVPNLSCRRGLNVLLGLVLGPLAGIFHHLGFFPVFCDYQQLFLDR
ncbi:hypothetical protein B0H13DRAFT_2005893, partial [Mycena leptocephala]